MVIVDILCIYSCLKILLCYRNDKEVYFILKSKGQFDQIGVKLLGWLNWKFIPLEYEFRPTGENPPYLNIRKMLEGFGKNYIDPIVKKEVDGFRCFSEYEKKRISIYLESSEKQMLYRSFEVLQILQDSKKYKERLNVVLLSISRWRDELAATYKEKGYNLDFYNICFSYRLQKRNKYTFDKLFIQSHKNNARFLSLLYLLSKIIWNVLNSLCFWVRRHISPDVPSGIGNFDIGAMVTMNDRTEWFHDLYWKKTYQGEKYRTLAMLYGRFDHRAYSEYGYLPEMWITLNRWSQRPYTFSMFYWLWPIYPRILFRNLTQLLKVIFGRKISWYFWLKIAFLWVEVSKMEALFRISGIKIFWSSLEGQLLENLGGTLAINRLSGVNVGSTWSVHGLPCFLHIKNFLDVWFAWGDYHVDILSQSGEFFKTMVICGYPGDFYIKNYLDKAINLRNVWKGQYNAETIICYYDNVSHNDSRHNLSAVVKFLECVLFWIQKKPGSLLVVKSKNKEVYNNYPVSILNLLKALENQKRLVWKFEKADLATGFSADIVLGLGLATLPCLLGTYGKDAILLDNNRINEKWPTGAADNIKFIKNPNDIIESLDNWSAQRHEQDTDRETIVTRPSPNRIDSFADGESAERIAMYISNLADDLKNGLEIDKATHNANVCYRGKWGSEKIIEFEELRKY